jgi:hypothetical protein
METAVKKPGRPKTPDYRKKTLRFSAIEKCFDEVIVHLPKEDRVKAIHWFEMMKEKLV